MTALARTTTRHRGGAGSSSSVRRVAQALAARSRSARLTALTMPLSDEVTIDGSIPTPHSTRPSAAASYLECAVGGRVLWGVGIDPSIVTSSLKGIVSAVNRAERDRAASA